MPGETLKILTLKIRTYLSVCGACRDGTGFAGFPDHHYSLIDSGCGADSVVGDQMA
jgi:hypothetical protein